MHVSRSHERFEKLHACGGVRYNGLAWKKGFLPEASGRYLNLFCNLREPNLAQFLSLLPQKCSKFGQLALIVGS